MDLCGNGTDTDLGRFLFLAFPLLFPPRERRGGGNILYGKEEGKIDFGFPDVFRKFIYSDEREMG